VSETAQVELISGRVSAPALIAAARAERVAAPAAPAAAAVAFVLAVTTTVNI